MEHLVQVPRLPPARLAVVKERLNVGRRARIRRERLAVLSRETEALLRMGAHPNVVAARSVFEGGGGRVVLVLDGVEGQTLRQRLKDGTPLTVEQRVQILTDVCRALSHAHAHQVIHRRVEPSSILLSEDGVTRLGRFSLAKILSESAVTVWHAETEGDLDIRYAAPELVNVGYGGPGPESDLYGLGCVAYELFAGKPPFANPGQAFGPLPTMPSGMPQDLEALLPSLLTGDPRQRNSDVANVLTVLEVIDASDEPRQVTVPKTLYEPGDLIDGKFEVREVLGGGGFSTVYRAYWSLTDREVALKVFNADVSYERVQREIRILMDVANEHVVKVFSGDQTRVGQWFIISELVRGETLEAFAHGNKRLSMEQAVSLTDELLSALEAIHPQHSRLVELRAKQDLTGEEYGELQELQQQGIVHRDIKPQNLMLTGRGVILIDFNISSQVGTTVHTLSGTPRYFAPDVMAGIETWDVSPDLFATGVVLYELVCCQHPYDDAWPRFGRGPLDPRQFRPEISPALAEFLMQACAPYSTDRFASALEMRQALADVDALTVSLSGPSEARDLPVRLQNLLSNAPANVNPMVQEFLALSSQARKSNRGTRGLDDLARATYVETRLDADLSRSVLAGEHRLVIITGNAGDGKTAFIQQVEAAAVQAGAEQHDRSPNGSRLHLPGREILTLYDGSQDEYDRTSDEILMQFFAPFAADGQPDGHLRLSAINEGCLRDFLLGHYVRFPRLAADIIAVLDDPTRELPTRDIVVVNLNLRSVTAGGATSIFSRQLRRIVEGPFWGPCETCDHRARCPLKHNVDTFRDPTSGDAVTERLRVLVDLVRLRRRRHLTMRDVRSLISHILFRDRECSDIPALLDSPELLNLIDAAYFQGPGGLGTPVGSALERNADLLTETDVADVSNPQIDWALAHGSGPLRMRFPDRSSDYPSELVDEMGQRAGRGYEANTTLARLAHSALRRLTFFERSDDGWYDMLPYQRLREFEAALQGSDEGARGRLRKEIIQAVSVYEGLPSVELATNALWLTTDETPGGELRCFRRFPSSGFDLRVVKSSGPYIESELDHLELVHQGGARLDLDIDLMEVLDRLKEGYVPSPEEGRGFLVNLDLFKNQLLAQPAMELFLVGPDLQMKITAGDGVGSVLLSEVRA
ncbi:MAG: protein kinase domain-containing protein [Chloroflexota bacterium]|nr:MAG: hypothetical protein DLM70_03200 [Chloroflexota bacterium]